MNNQSPNSNNQINTNHQIPITKLIGFGKLVIDYWLLFGVCLLVIGIYGCQNKPPYKETRLAMGTFVEVISPQKEAARIVFDEIKRIEELLSKYNPNSEISRLNREGRIKASPETFYIIKKSKEFWQLSEGAFDISIGPLMDLWGFSDKKYRLPPDEEIARTLKLVGADKIILRENEFVVELKIPGMILDLGGIAKGYAVDCAVKKLKESGVQSCLINAGGNIYALGSNYGHPWKVAIKNPRGGGTLQDYINLSDIAVATSGDYEQYFNAGKKRYAHIFNPKTGYPTQSGLASVTVVAPDATTADALSTAIFVLGKQKGETLLKNFPGVKAKIIE